MESTRIAWVFSRSSTFVLFVILLLAVGLLLRIQLLGYWSSDYTTMTRDDIERDYLVAHHIVAYHEYPFRGPDSTWASSVNSPAYFYALAIPLFVKDSTISLGLFNAILQTLAVLFVFLLARTLFGTGTAFIAALLFGFNQNILFQSAFVWQPHIVQPLLILSYLLLAAGYSKKNFECLLGSAFFFFFSVALYIPVLVLAPFYIFFLFRAVKNLGGTIQQYAEAAFTCIISFILFYIPLFLYLEDHLAGEINFVAGILSGRADLSSAMHFLFPTGALFFGAFVGNAVAAALPKTILLTISVLVLYYFFCYERDIQKKKIALAILSSTAWLLFVSSFFPLRGEPVFRYFVPILGPAFVFIAEVINSSPNRAFKAVLVVAMLFMATPNLALWTKNSMERLFADGSGFFAIPYKPPPFLGLLENEILELKKLEKRDDYGFLGFRLYAKESETGLYARRHAEEVFWNPLEIETRTKLTALDDTTVRSFRPLSDEQYIFLACPNETDTAPCLDAFLRDFPRYKPQKQFRAEPYQMYLTKRD